MTASEDRLSAKVAATLGAPALSLSPAELRVRMLSAGSFWLSRLLPELEEAVHDPALLAEEAERAQLARFIVAALPESASLLERILAEPWSGGAIGELQFSLFVALSDVGESPEFRGVRDQLAAMMRAFIENVEVDDAEAAWMAADALGDHWPLALSLEVLRSTARGAKHRAGREAALHGLSHALVRADKRQQWAIVEVLRAVEREDLDDAVRRYAAHILGEFRGL